MKTISKRALKKKVKSYVVDLNKNPLLEDSKKYKKLNHDEMEREEFGRKDYFNNLDLEGVRLRMKISSKVIPTIRSHFKRKYKEQSLRCPSCKLPSSQEEAIQPDSNSNGMDQIQTPESTDQAGKSSSYGSEDFPLDSSSHLIHHCPTFRKNLRNKDLSKDEDLVSFSTK